MSLYVDSSVLLKRYVEEPDSEQADVLLASDPLLLTARHTIVEVRRNLARLLDEREAAAAKAAFTRDIAALAIIELDAVTCDAAADVADLTGARTLDALHLAAARRLGSGPAVTFATFDVRQAQAARTLGLTVLPA